MLRITMYASMHGAAPPHPEASPVALAEALVALASALLTLAAAVHGAKNSSAWESLFVPKAPMECTLFLSAPHAPQQHIAVEPEAAGERLPPSTETRDVMPTVGKQAQTLRFLLFLLSALRIWPQGLGLLGRLPPTPNS